MNLNLIKNKMEQFGVSCGYMADCCGVGERYLKQCLSGSKPMTKVLLKKVKGVIKTLNINPKSQKFKEQQKKKMVTDLKSDPIVIVKKEEPTVVYKNRSLKEILVAFGEHFGISQHSMEFNNGGYHYIFRLDVSEVDE